jgi:hypothetical protein
MAGCRSDPDNENYSANARAITCRLNRAPAFQNRGAVFEEAGAKI